MVLGDILHCYNHTSTQSMAEGRTLSFFRSISSGDYEEIDAISKAMGRINQKRAEIRIDGKPSWSQQDKPPSVYLDEDFVADMNGFHDSTSQSPSTVDRSVIKPDISMLPSHMQDRSSNNSNNSRKQRGNGKSSQPPSVRIPSRSRSRRTPSPGVPLFQPLSSTPMTKKTSGKGGPSRHSVDLLEHKKFVTSNGSITDRGGSTTVNISRKRDESPYAQVILPLLKQVSGKNGLSSSTGALAGALTSAQGRSSTRRSRSKDPSSDRATALGHQLY